MLSFVQNWFAPKANPIGIDFGSDALRLAQVQCVEGEWRLAAAATAEVPTQVRADPSTRLVFFVETVRDLLSQGGFRGRQAVLSLPAAMMFIQHLRLPRMDEATLKKTLPFEARGKLPIDPNHALIRHLVAGEVFQEQEPRDEVIVMAAARDGVHALLDAAARARLDVVGMNVEPKALVDCFAHVYRRKTDAEVTNCFVDIGYSGTRVLISRGGFILFARSIPIGGEHFARAAVNHLKIDIEEARMLRIKLALLEPNLDEHRRRQQVEPAPAGESFALLNAGLATATAAAPRISSEDAPAVQAAAVEAACREPLSRLIGELDLCRRYYESTFPAHPVERLIFVGGEARQRGLCQTIAREMALAAQVGDPLVRMGRNSDIGPETGIDRRHPQPAWAVAIGLSFGPPAASGASPTTTVERRA